MAIDYRLVLDKAEGYKRAISRFLRDLIALPSESCQEKEVIRRIRQENEIPPPPPLSKGGNRGDLPSEMRRQPCWISA